MMGSSSEPVQLDSFQQLQKIDLLLLQKKYDMAAAAFLVLLENLGTHLASRHQLREFHKGDPLDEAAEVCQRASAQWLALLSSPLDFTRINLVPLINNMHILHAVLMGTRQGNLDGYASALHLSTGGQYNTQTLLRLILAWCPNTQTGFIPFSYYQYLPEIVMAHAVATVAGLALVSEAENKARNAAIAFLCSGTPRAETLARYKAYNLAPHAWMRCSYADQPDKHQVKQFLGQVIERAMQLPKSFLLPEKPAQENNKPVLLVPLEHMQRDHAMYRCYADRLAALKDLFFTVGIGIEGQSDDHTVALFDDFLMLKEVNNPDGCKLAFEQVQKLMSRVRPAMAYFPSVGMDPWVISLANRRLAPIQSMGLGHPATSMSKAMDYVLVAEDMLGNPECFSEQVFVTPEGAVRYGLPSGSERIEPIISPPFDGVIRVAVPSVAQKLTAGFVRCLREAQEQSDNRLEFVFFSGASNVNYAMAAHGLMRELKAVSVLPWQDYASYIRELNRCHLHAATFPFGGTNSLLDSLRQGLPVLTLEGAEVHSRVDANFVRRAGLPENFICRTEQEYTNRLLELVRQPEELFRWRKFLIEEADVDRVFMHQARPEVFAESVFRLYQDVRSA